MHTERSPHLGLAKSYWQAHLTSADLAIDATCGNGRDTFFLAALCRVIGLDIQNGALLKTQELLQKGNQEALLYQLSHEWIDTIPLPLAPKLIVYNLGYLPGGDKSITTRTETTLISLKKSAQLLAAKGALSVMCYPGHEEGLIEERAVVEWAKTLSAPQWSVCYHQWLSKPRSPSLLWILKLVE